MIKDEIADLVRGAATTAQQAGEIPRVTLPEVIVERPQRSENGDYATSLPLRLKKALGGPGSPIDLARTIARHIEPGHFVREVVAAPPGFINFYISEEWLQHQVDAIIGAGAVYGASDVGSGTIVQVEFVSANPTGPVHVGNGRGAVTGSTLARILEATGHRVEREYYVNDAGTQTETFARTLYARYQQLFGRDVPVPEDGYPGSYMTELAEQIRAQYGDGFLEPEVQPPPPELRDIGVALVVQQIQADLELLGVRYDEWFSERSLYGSGTYDHAMELLRERGHVNKREGAVWFTSSELGQEKDNVLVRTGGSPTYFASDIAYHFDKFLKRRFDRVIDIWGADHQGHVARLKTAIGALGVDPDRLTILLYQLVTLRRGPETVRLSKRSGDIITLREVVEEVGADACRFFFLTRSPDAPMDFDLELAKKQSNDNPVYYVQYAHARTAGILSKAAEQGIDDSDGDTSLLKHSAELALIRRMVILPELIEFAARKLEVHHLPHYAQELASDLNVFYDNCRVLGEEMDLAAARLKLVLAAKTVLARVLDLMGMSAPERM